MDEGVPEAVSDAADPDGWLAAQLLAWFRRHGRKDLPWQRNPTPYRVWISEIMLQQTQVQAVIPYFDRFMARFPDVRTLAQAQLDEVLHLWSGLGYYARARNLHKTARLVQANGGAFPDTLDGLQALPGIGRSTAGAILALAYGQPATILDGNVKRVLARFHAIADPLAAPATMRNLWARAEAHRPSSDAAEYVQAIMDLGATLCTKQAPQCPICPLRTRCAALAGGRVAEIPVRGKTKVKPVRQVRMYVISTPAGACLLERRPEQGIWGGLWTPPQRALDRTAAAVCREFGIPANAIVAQETAPPFRHSFTHFHLDIEPCYVRLNRRPLAVRDDDAVIWRPADATTPIGLSAPAAKLIASLKPDGQPACSAAHEKPDAGNPPIKASRKVRSS